VGGWKWVVYFRGKEGGYFSEERNVAWNRPTNNLKKDNKTGSFQKRGKGD